MKGNYGDLNKFSLSSIISEEMKSLKPSCFTLTKIILE